MREKPTHKQKDLLAIKHNAEILNAFLNANEVKKAEVTIELLCMQIKIFLDHPLFCTINRDSIKSLKTAGAAADKKE
jgi:hypothetical protein